MWFDRSVREFGKGVNQEVTSAINVNAEWT